MEAQNTDTLAAPDFGPVPGEARASARAAPSFAIVGGGLTLLDPPQAPGADWQDALELIAQWLGIGVNRISADRAAGLRQLARWPMAAASPAAPVFAPWLAHSCLAFQHRRSLRAMQRADWVASYLWDPCPGAPRVARPVDVMLISAHPAVCRVDEDCDAALPGARLLRIMIAAAEAEGRRRIAIVGHERCRSAVSRQLLAGKPTLAGDDATLEVVAIEQAVVRLAQDVAAWDAIIVAPELRSLLFAMLARTSGIAAPWPMVWQRQDRLVLVCAENAEPAAAPAAPLDAALLAQALALAARGGGLAFAARRLCEAWARLRDRGMVTPSRGSPAPYTRQTGEAELVEWLCREPAEGGRVVAGWQALAALHEGAAMHRPPARLALVTPD